MRCPVRTGSSRPRAGPEQSRTRGRRGSASRSTARRRRQRAPLQRRVVPLVERLALVPPVAPLVAGVVGGLQSRLHVRMRVDRCDQGRSGGGCSNLSLRRLTGGRLGLGRGLQLVVRAVVVALRRTGEEGLDPVEERHRTPFAGAEPGSYEPARTESRRCRSYTRRVDASALDVLEFPAIAERLAAATATTRGAELARTLRPTADDAEVARRQALTAEAVALLDEAAEPPLHGIHDVRDTAAYADRGGTLTPEALGRVAATIGGGLRARAALEGEAERAPLLAGLGGQIDPALAPLAEQISRCVEDDGSDLRDNASPLLRKLRRELRDGRQRVADELRRLARAPALQEHLQEDFVAQRGGRPVLAV